MYASSPRSAKMPTIETPVNTGRFASNRKTLGLRKVLVLEFKRSVIVDECAG